MKPRAALAALVALLGCLCAAAPGAALTQEESRLRARLAPALRAACAVTDPALKSPAARASLTCDLLAGEGVLARFEAFRSHAEAGRNYRSLVAQVPETRTDRGSCPSQLPSESIWLQGVDAGGRLACHLLADGTARIVWTEPEAAVVAVATRPDADMLALERWWERTPLSGPPDPRVTTIGGLFPDPFEVALMRSLPDSFRFCEREPYVRSRRTILARLACLSDAGRVQVVISRYAGLRPMLARWQRLLGRNDIARATGARARCVRDQPVALPFTDRGVINGQVACFFDRGRAALAWYDLRNRLGGAAGRNDRNLTLLHAWWRTRTAPPRA